jgi:hypothetical protein
MANSRTIRRLGELLDPDFCAFPDCSCSIDQASRETYRVLASEAECALPDRPDPRKNQPPFGGWFVNDSKFRGARP